MKFSVALVFIASYAFGQDQAPAPDVESACGPQGVKLEVKVDRLRHPAPAPPDGKALVYVVNQEIHDNIGVDEVIGISQGFVTEPGSGVRGAAGFRHISGDTSATRRLKKPTSATGC